MKTRQLRSLLRLLRTEGVSEYVTSGPDGVTVKLAGPFGGRSTGRPADSESARAGSSPAPRTKQQLSPDEQRVALREAAIDALLEQSVPGEAQ